jgi:hypothetical protein
MTQKIFYVVYLVGLGKELVNNHNTDTYIIGRGIVKTLEADECLECRLSNKDK